MKLNIRCWFCRGYSSQHYTCARHPDLVKKCFEERRKTQRHFAELDIEKGRTFESWLNYVQMNRNNYTKVQWHDRMIQAHKILKRLGES